MNKQNGAVFLDRDGTVIVNKHYQKDPDETELFPDSRSALARLRAAGFPLILVSNQSGIARGYLNADDFQAIEERLAGLLGEEASFRSMYHCPHGPEDSCDCRKPRPGMLLRAAADLGVNLRDSYMVGDSEADIRAGQAVGARTVLVLTGNGRKAAALPGLQADHVAADLSAAADWILAHSQGEVEISQP